MAAPTPRERELLAVYQSAERYLLLTTSGQLRRVVNARHAAEAQRRAEGLRVVQAATQSVRQALDGVIPGMIGEILTAAAGRGAAEAVRQLQTITGQRDGYNDRAGRGQLDRLAVTLLGRVAEAHLSILRTVPDAYRDAIARVLPAQLVGVETRRQVSQRAWWDLAERGLTTFTDQGGRNWQLSSYVEMATRAASQRAALDAQHDRLQSAGRDLVIVQGSGDRCEKCRPWHGKILTITGGTRGTIRVEHATQDGVFIEVQVAGSVDDARAAGWGHPQCRCSTSAYLPGVTKPIPPAPDNGQYKARQRQRTLEREIRAAKDRQAAVVGAAEQEKQAARHLASAQARMRTHLADNPDLLRRRYREGAGAGNIPRGERRRQVAADRAADVGRDDP